MRVATGAFIFLLAVGYSIPAAARDAMDRVLRDDIARIRAIDDHTHDDPVSARRGAGWHADSPLGLAPYPDVVPLRRDDPQWIRAWKALYGYPYADLAPEHLSTLLATKRARMEKAGQSWPVQVLDAAGVQTAFVNAPHLGAGQNSARFRWVPFADPLLAPFSANRSLMAYPGGRVTLDQLMREGAIGAMPETLADYLVKVVEPTLARWQSAGAPAVKFLSAYRRALDFDLVSFDRASKVYRQGFATTPLSGEDERALEDFLFMEVSARSAAHGLVVQIHTGNGNGPFFDNGAANPALLERALGSERLRGARFVLLHGGWPFHALTQSMLDKPNTYADFSAQTFYLSTHALAEVLRGWLEWHPEKVLFGTDAYSDENTPLSDYEEKQWLLTEKARDAVAIALTAMMTDGEISRSRAREIAEGVLRGNAVRLYGLKTAN